MLPRQLSVVKQKSRSVSGVLMNRRGKSRYRGETSGKASSRTFQMAFDTPADRVLKRLQREIF
jgi:hypothetical protein